MKRLLLFLLLAAGGLTPLRAAPYSHTEETDSLPRSRFLADTLLHKNEITYCVAMPDGEDEFLNTGHISLMLQTALREWTHGIALRIRAAGRAEEMADILRILDKPLTLTRLPACDLTRHPLISKVHPDFDPAGEKADLTVIVSSAYCTHLRGQVNSFFIFEYKDTSPFMCLLNGYANPVRSPAAQDYFPMANTQEDKALAADAEAVFRRAAQGGYDTAFQTRLWRLNRLFEFDGHAFFAIIAHELGHAFGLGDEYLTDRPCTYASQTPGEGLMFNGYQPISCDEVDGMITLLDRFAGKKRTFASFCSGRGLIQNGQEVPPAEPLSDRLAERLLPLIRH